MFVEKFTTEQMFEARMSQNDVTYNHWFEHDRHFNIIGYVSVAVTESKKRHFLNISNDYFCVIKKHSTGRSYVYGVNYFISLMDEEYLSIRQGKATIVDDLVTGIEILLNPEAANVS